VMRAILPFFGITPVIMTVNITIDDHNGGSICLGVLAYLFGNVFSRWYDDLMVMWRNGHYIKMRSYSRLCKIRPHGHCLIFLPQKKKF
ncbi:hypothetical protein, partial [Coxiella burnetii]|uniref:hypothetical protein n=1 Tax=Coxiella burnetii TaxID=777 RepID=UPI00222F2782